MELIEFLVEAKINTYASEKPLKKKLSDGSKELVYKKGEFIYRDRYFGFNSFTGQEVVFEGKKAIWLMNYQGEILSKVISTKEIYDFLKKVLRQVPKEYPFRGPKKFNDGNLSYENKGKGKIERFKGTEKIFYKGKLIYELIYHGGEVKE
jgi:hypothetical protein